MTKIVIPGSVALRVRELEFVWDGFDAVNCTSKCGYYTCTKDTNMWYYRDTFYGNLGLAINAMQNDHREYIISQIVGY